MTFRTAKYCFHLERHNQNSLFGNKCVIYEPGNESLKPCTLFSSRSSCLWMVYKIAKMKHFRKFSVTFTVNSFSNKYASNSIKKGFHNGIFQGNFLKHLFSKHLRTVIFQNIFGSFCCSMKLVITCKKPSCYMCDSACRQRFVKNTKKFWSYIK